MKSKLVFLCLLLAGALVLSGCAGLVSSTEDNQNIGNNQTPSAELSTPETPMTTPEKLVLPKPKEHTGLTDEEWEKAVQVALTLPELSEWLAKGLPYRAEPRWFYKRPGSTTWRINVDFISPDTPNVTDVTRGVEVSLGSPQQIVFDIAVDLAAEKTVTFESYDLHLLPASQFNLRYLTEEEFAEVIRIASEATGVSIDLAIVEPYWWAINGGIYHRYDYDAVEKGIEDLSGVNGATFYPAITVPGGPYGYQSVIVDLKNGRVLETIAATPK